jgi:tetratricopeptide (TPR) repeat protein
MLNPTLKKPVVLATIFCLAVSGSLFARGSSKKEGPSYDVKVYNEGVARMEKGDLKSAQAHFEAAIAKKEDFAEAHNNLGYVLRRQGKEHYAAALEHYNRAIELNPKLAQAYEYRGVLYVLQGEEDKAKADHAKLAELDPKLADELLQVIASREEPKGDGGLAPKWADHH